MTDPSFHAQLITFTAPMVGNYGVSAEAMESDRVHARAAIMREAVDAEDAPGAEGGLARLARATDGVPGITGVDTRALVRHIRDAGAMRGGDLPRRHGARTRRAALIAAEPPMTGRDLAREVTPREPRVIRRRRLAARGSSRSTPASRRSIIRNFTQRGATLELLPCDTPADGGCSRAAPTASSSSPAPATPRRSTTSSTTVREADRADARVRDLPRPPAALPGGRAGDVQAPVRPPRRQPPGQGPAHGPDRDHARRTTASRSAASRASGCRPTSARPS